MFLIIKRNSGHFLNIKYYFSLKNILFIRNPDSCAKVASFYCIKIIRMHTFSINMWLKFAEIGTFYTSTSYAVCRIYSIENRIDRLHYETRKGNTFLPCRMPASHSPRIGCYCVLYVHVFMNTVRTTHKTLSSEYYKKI